MAEAVFLDPVEVAASGRTQLEITPWLDADGIDWDDATVSEFLADMDRGSMPIDVRFPNRSVAGGFVFDKTFGGTTAAVARATIGRKLALFQREGGTLKRITSTGGTVYADVMSAMFHATSVSGIDSRQLRDPSASFSLECIPDFYGDEITLGDHVNTTGNELVFTETGILGDYPGRVRVVVDNDEASTDFLGLMYAFRSRNYSAATTAKVVYEAEAGQALDAASVGNLLGASGGTVVRHTSLSTKWTPVYGTNLGGTAFLTHQGSYRLRARVYSTSGTLVQTRAVYDVGDLVSPAENDPVRLPGASNFYIVDYGELRLDPVGQGTHRWQGQIQARGDVGTENFSVDEIYLEPLDEGGGVLSATPAPTAGLTVFAARDEFNQTAGTLTGKVMPVGGTWTGAGAAGDWSVDTTGHTAQRTSTGDSAGAMSGRFEFSGLAASGLQGASVDVSRTANAVFIDQGLVLRYVDTSNFVIAAYESNSATVGAFVVRQYLAGATSVLAIQFVPLPTVGAWYTVSAYADTVGRVIAQLAVQGASFPLAVLAGQSSAIATGGALISGKTGIYDTNTSATASTRSFDNFAQWVPSPDAAIYATRTAQLTTDGIVRQDSTGSAYGPAVPIGDLPRIPPSGNEGRTVEVFLKPSLGDFANIPDSAINSDISAKISYRPSYLFVP